MSETPAPAAAAPAAPAATEKKGKSALLARLLAICFMLAVIGGECLVACYYLPSVSASAPAAAKADEHDSHESEDPDEHHSAPSLKREVDLGKFNITSFQAATNATLLIDFHLYGTVVLDGHASGDAKPAAGGHGGGHGGHGEKAASEEDEFSRLFEKHKHRLRDQVIVIIRSSEIADYSDPSLGLIRRKILEKSNRLLGKPLLEEVIFSDFSIIEQ